MTDKKGAPEFSRPVVVADLEEETELRFEADDDERRALAGRLGVDRVDGLTADLRIVREIGALVRLSGHVSADVTQSCVVTLAPVAGHREFDLDIRFAPPELVAEMEDDEELLYEEEDPPDPIVDGVIDLGDVVAEYLALEIDPFPRAEGAEFSGYATGPAAEEGAGNPFAVLRDLVKKPK